MSKAMMNDIEALKAKVATLEQQLAEHAKADWHALVARIEALEASASAKVRSTLGLNKAKP